MPIDFNREGPDRDLAALLDAAEANAKTEFEIEFCASLHERFRRYGDQTTLTAAQEHKSPASIVGALADLIAREAQR